MTKNFYFYTISIRQLVLTFLTGHTIILTWILCQMRSVKLNFVFIRITSTSYWMYCNYQTKLRVTMDYILMAQKLFALCLKDLNIHADILTLSQGLLNLSHSYALPRAHALDCGRPSLVTAQQEQRVNKPQFFRSQVFHSCYYTEYICLFYRFKPYCRFYCRFSINIG